MVEERSDQILEENRKSSLSVDWRGRPCSPNKRYGGMKAAVFVLGLQALEIMAIAGVGNNLISYVFNDMHFSLSKSANIVTNFVGTIFLLSLLGGFVSDSYLGTFSTILISSFVELLGLILLTVQAHVPGLRPPSCDMTIIDNKECREAEGYEAAVFFAAIYLVALGSGCLKPNIIAHGAAQFGGGGDEQDERTKKRLSSYFNVAYFAFCAGELVALTLFVWVQTHSGMDFGFGVSVAAMALALLCFVSATALYRNTPPAGSIFTPVAQVFVAAFSKRKQICPSSTNTQNNNETPKITNKLRFLEMACMRSSAAENNVMNRNDVETKKKSRYCSAEEVEQVKRIVCVIPIFASTIIFNTILAQLQTFSVQQGSVMDARLSSSFSIPPASLQAIPYALLIFLVPLYEAVFVPAARALTSHPSGISPLQRIGAGLFTATFSMVAAALAESRRRKISAEGDSPPSILWIAPQFLIFGVSEMFTAVGLIEFFYGQSVANMTSFMTAMTYVSYSFGFYLSSVLVTVVNRLTPGAGWLGLNDLDDDRLDLFYWLLAALSLLNFFNYLFWSNWYSKTLPPKPIAISTTQLG